MKTKEGEEIFRKHPKLNFLVSNKGRVFSLETHKILKQAKNSWGYRAVSGGHFVHILVYETFHGRIKKGMDIDHIDRNKNNNTPENLRMVTKSINAFNRRTKRH